MSDAQGSTEDSTEEGPLEIGFVGDLTENQEALTEKLLEVPHQGECIIYFDSPGGSPYSAISYVTMIMLRQLNATGIVTGECSSSALWPLAACRRRFVTPHSVLLFHPLKSQSDESIGLAEAAEWSRHFSQLEKDMDQLLVDLFGVAKSRIDEWMNPGRYVSRPRVCSGRTGGAA